MLKKPFFGLVLGLISFSCAAQVVSPTYRPRLAVAAGAGMNYWTGDWGLADGTIHRWGPSAWGTATVWHDLSVIAEGHSMIWGGGQGASEFKYFTGGGGLIYMSDYWGRFQPYVKAEAGFASLSHPSNLSGHLHDTSNIWTLGGGFEYHNGGNWWTQVGYSYDFFPNFYSGITGQTHSLNPAGITIGETFRFGPSGSKF